MSLTILQSDDVTPVTDLPITNYDAGVDSDVLELHPWNNTGQAIDNLLFVLRTESLTAAGVYLAAGIPPQDERWGRARVIGYDNTGDPTWSTPDTDWAPLGAYSGVPLATIPDGCAVHLELKMHPPSTAESTQWRHRLTAFADEYSQPTPLALTKVHRGVISAIGDRSRSGLLSGCLLTETGTPDDFVQISAGWWVYRGTLVSYLAGSEELDQNDGAAAALAATQSYIAAFSCGATGITVTKGLLGTSPTAPAHPSDEAFLGYVTVDYNASASVIETDDIDESLRVRTDLAVEDDGGLAVRVHAGEAMAGGTWRYHFKTSPVTLTASSTNRIWQLGTGLFSATTTATAPEDGALLLAEAVTDGSGVTSIVDKRVYARPAVTLTADVELTTGTGEKGGFEVAHDYLFVEDIAHAWSDDGTGSSGSTIIDIHVNGTTIYTSQGSDDQRPTLAWNAGAAWQKGTKTQHEVTPLERGDLVTFEADAVPAAGNPPVRVVFAFRCRQGWAA